jgi:hypothetical protein
MKRDCIVRFRTFLVLVSILGLLAVLPSVNATGTGILVGQVITLDMDAQPIPQPVPLSGAKVTVYANGAVIQSVSLNDFEGSYSLYLPSGLYVVTAECPGFSAQSRVVAISDEHSTRVDFFLQRAPAVKSSAFDFGLSSAGSMMILAGGSSWTTIQVTLYSGLPQTVNVSVSGLPPGTYASLSPSVVNASFPVVCMITTSLATPVGSYNVIVIGVGGGKIHSTSFTLTISNYNRVPKLMPR